MQIDANDEPGSINGGNQTHGKWTESSPQSPIGRREERQRLRSRRRNRNTL